MGIMSGEQEPGRTMAPPAAEADPMSEPTEEAKKIEALTSSLERTLSNFKVLLRRGSVRDAAEAISPKEPPLETPCATSS